MSGCPGERSFYKDILNAREEILRLIPYENLYRSLNYTSVKAAQIWQ